MIALLHVLLVLADPGIVEPLPTGVDPPPAEMRAPPPAVPSDIVPLGALKLEPPNVLASGARARRPKSYLLAALETGALFMAGAIWYWDRTWYSDEDGWDLHFNWSSWEKKLDFSAVRFDTDRWDTSAGDHPRAALGYYLAARGNGFSFAASYAWAVASEVLWAYFVEWDEQPSLNDMVMGPQSGVPVGESVFRLGEFLDASAPTLPNRLGAFLVSPSAAINDLATGRRPTPEGPFDEFGFTRAIQHRFVLAAGILASDLDGKRDDLASFGVESSLASYAGRAGRGWLSVAAGERTELEIGVLASHGLQGDSVHSSTIFGGRYFRSYEEPDPDDPRARPVGWGALLALGTALDYDRRQLSFIDDRVISSGMLGPVVDVAADRGAYGVHLSLAAYYSLAIIQSLAYAAFGFPSPTAAYQLSTPLEIWGYYYGQGITSQGKLTAHAGWLELGLTARYGAYWSINSFDRYQERLRDETTESDTRSMAIATLALRPFRVPLRLTATLEGYDRASRIAETRVVSKETRAGLGLDFLF
jgi:hypothetical protein